MADEITSRSRLETNNPDIPRETAVNSQSVDGGVGILDLLIILLGRKWFIFLGTLLTSIISVISVFLMTSYYTSVVVVLPSQQKMGLPFSALLGDLPGGVSKSLDLLGGQDNNGKFFSIIESRRLAEKVISKFDLVARYGFKKKKKFYSEDVLKEYHKRIWSEEDDNGNIKINVKDTTPETASEIANYIASQLDSISFQLAQSSARGSRLFFEERLRLIRHDLDSVHRAFADFQITNNFVDLDAQMKSSIEAMAGLEAEVMATDIENEMLSSSFGSNSKMVENQRKKAVLSRRLSNYLQKGSGSLLLPLKKAPELGIIYANLYRDVKIQEGINSMVIQLYEQAKFREANNSPVVNVLEPAFVPQKRSSPKRMVFCFTITLLGFSLLVTWVLISHWYQIQLNQSSETGKKLQVVLKHFLWVK